jgi:hypothetical protein
MSKPPFSLHLRLFFASLLLCFTASLTAQEAGPPTVDSAQAAREAQFGKLLSGSTFVGRYTDSNQPAGALPKEDRYTIHKVSKIQGDMWLFQTRIQYGEHDVTLPLPLKVLWAGNTPVITLDKVPVPGMGSFDARVLIHGDQYSGTWSGANHGGHLFGRIEKAEATEKPASAATDPAKDGE